VIFSNVGPPCRPRAVAFAEDKPVFSQTAQRQLLRDGARGSSQLFISNQAPAAILALRQAICDRSRSGG
jgi:hypothetical protein